MEDKIKNFKDLKIWQKCNEIEFAELSLTIHFNYSLFTNEYSLN